MCHKHLILPQTVHSTGNRFAKYWLQNGEAKYSLRAIQSRECSFTCILFAYDPYGTGIDAQKALNNRNLLQVTAKLNAIYLNYCTEAKEATSTCPGVICLTVWARYQPSRKINVFALFINEHSKYLLRHVMARGWKQHFFRMSQIR